jgi:hypothetical protein
VLGVQPLGRLQDRLLCAARPIGAHCLVKGSMYQRVAVMKSSKKLKDMKTKKMFKKYLRYMNGCFIAMKTRLDQRNGNLIFFASSCFSQYLYNSW